MAHEQRSVPELDPTDLEAPDIGFKAGFGFYLGLVLAGVTAVGGLLAGASTEVVLATTPGTVMAGLICALVFGGRLRRLPVQLGRSRKRRAVWYVPSIAFAATLPLPAVTPLAYTTAFVVTAIVFALLTAAVGLGNQVMARNRYVEAVAADEPAATWTWQRGRFVGGRFRMVTGIVLIGVGLYSLWSWGAVMGPFIVLYGAIFLLEASEYTDDWTGFDETERWNPATIHAHEPGLVLERGVGKSLVPWDAIEDVRLTDDELVLERRWFDIRCDRSAIDDPESVLEAIERARGRTHTERATDLAD